MFLHISSSRVHRGPAKAGLLACTALLVSSCNESTPLSPDALDTVQPTSAAIVQDAEYLVRFGDSEQDAPGLTRDLVRASNATLRFTYTHAIKGFAARIPEKALTGILRNPRVLSVERDRPVTADGAGVQGSPPSWGLDRADQRGTSLDRAYSWKNDGTGVYVYVFDTGIRSTHADFVGRVVAGFNTTGDTRGWEDCNGHGTHVAGTVGGTRYGVAKGVRLVPVRVLGCDGGGQNSNVIAGIDLMLKDGRRPAVANFSLGSLSSATLNAAIDNASNAGVVIVAAAGNSGGDACGVSPAGAPSAISVGATSGSDAFASFSNWGPCVHLLAPGVSILSASPADDFASHTMSGTSMAAPHVAGAAALVLAATPSSSASDVRAVLVANGTGDVVSAVPGNTPNRLLYTGFVGTGVLPPWGSNDTPNAAPTASFSATCSDRTCSFRDESRDSDGVIAARSWSFGSGATSTSSAPTFTFPAYGTYSVTLTVTDDRGATAAVDRSITVTAPVSTVLLSASARLQGQNKRVDLRWSGASAARIDVYRDGRLITTQSNTGTYTDAVGRTVRSVTHRVCASGTSTCSSSVTTAF